MFDTYEKWTMLMRDCGYYTEPAKGLFEIGLTHIYKCEEIFIWIVSAKLIALPD